MPSAITRVWWNRVALIGIVLVGALASAASAVGETTSVRIASEVDANWRGAYDILVRPAGARLDVERTAGVVEPNFLNFAGQGGITLAQLEAIRATEDVELAAPVGFVGFIHADASSPAAYLPEPPAQPTLQRLTFTLISDDGLMERLVFRETGRLLWGPDAQRQGASDLQASLSSDPGGDVTTRAPVPPIRSPLLAVDPVADRLLLGPSAGFLAPLEEVADVGRTAQAFGSSRIPDAFEFTRLLLDRAARRQADEITSEPQAAIIRGRPVIPVIVSSTTYAALTLRLEVETIGQPLEAYPRVRDASRRLEAAERAAGSTSIGVGVSTLDVGERLRALQLASLAVAWPGTSIPREAGQMYAGSQQQLLDARLVDRPRYDAAGARPGGTDLSFRIEHLGVAGPSRPIVPPGSSNEGLEGRVELGGEPAYRGYRDSPLVVLDGYLPQGLTDQPFYYAPLAEFDLATLELPDNPLNYVPMGAYDPPDTTFVAGPDGGAVEPRLMRPGLEPAGLITVPPLAITDIASAVILRGPAPIDAVRVRVAGVTDFGELSQSRIESVATRIATMGLDVDIVAGSSPQPVEVYVPGYFIDEQPARDLGWVRQGWTTLGAAERVESGLASATLALLSLAVSTAAVCAIGLQLMSISTRRREVAILRAWGWSRLQVVRWLLAEALVGGLAVAALGALGWWFGGRSPSAAAAGVAIAVVYVLAASVGAVIALRGAEGGRVGSLRTGDVWTAMPRVGPLAVRGPASFGLRTLLARPARTLALVGGLVVSGAAFALGVGLIATVLARVGPTLLASAITGLVQPFQMVLIGLTALVGLVFTLVVWRLDARDRAAEAVALASVGWSPRDLLATRLTAALVVGLMAAAGASLLALALAPALPEIPLVPALAAAALSSMVLAVVGGMLAGRAAPRLSTHA